MKLPNITLATKSGKPYFDDRLKKLVRMATYVGVPAQKSSRRGEKINNAEVLFVNTRGVRAKSMRDEMAASMKAGKTYSDAHALYLHAHGSPLWHSPPRPVIEPAIQADGNKEAISNELAKFGVALLAGNSSEAASRLKRAGQAGQNAARNWFTDPRNNWAPNAPSTIRRKKSDKPMIDRGLLRNAIIHVEREE